MKKIFVNGCFDVIHVGHLRLLEFAKSLGDFLLVAIDTDDRIRKSKGANRPINTLAERMELLSALKWVDAVVYFNSAFELKQHIKLYKPDIMVKGNDYIGKPIIGSEYCREIVYMDKTGHSSTAKIQSIVDRGRMLRPENSTDPKS